MALLDFPTGPNTNDTTTQNGNTWKWNGTSWVAFNNLSLSSQVSGILGTVYGGTGKALSSLTVGSVLYADTSSSFAALAPGTSNYVLATQGSGQPPYWKVDDSGTGSVGSGITGGFSYYLNLNSITSGSGFSYIAGSGNGGTVVLTNGLLSLIGSTINSGTWAGSAVTLAYGGTNNNISGIGHSYRIAIFDAAGTAITNISSSGTASSVLFQSAQNSSPSWVGQNTLIVGGATTSAQWQTARTVTFGGGDVTGSFSINGSADVSSIALTIAANSVALGTDTTGNYAQSVAVAGNGLTIGGAAGEGTDFTVYSNGVSTNTVSTLVFRDSSGNFSAGTITANLTGIATSSTRVGIGTNTTNSSFPLAFSDVNQPYASLGSTTLLSVNPSTSTITATNFSGNATTATNAGASGQWSSSRTVTFGGGDVTGSFSINGSADVSSVALTIAANSVALGTDTTGNYAQSVAVAGNGLTIGGAAGEGTDFTVYSNGVSANTVSTLVFRDGSGNFSAGTITANLTGIATSSTRVGIGTNTTNSSFPLVFSDVNQPYASLGSTTLLSVNPSTSTITATNFSGLASSASNIFGGVASAGSSIHIQTGVNTTGFLAHPAAAGYALTTTSAGLVYGLLTSLAVTSLAAGNGINVSATSGAVTIGNIGVTSITGTANRVTVSASGSGGTGAVTLTTPQDIHTSASPQFTDLTLNGGSSTLSTVGSSPTSMVNKQYVDNLASGLDIHDSVRLVLTSAIGASYYQPNYGIGNTATGAYLTSIGNSTFPAFDGVTIGSTGILQRVLVTGGLTATGKTSINGSALVSPATLAATNLVNGIYYLGSVGSGSSQWYLYRAAETDDNTELTGGTFTFVEEGTLFKDTGWVCTNDTINLGPIQFGSTAISFSQFTGAAAINFGQGITRVGNTVATNINLSATGAASGTGYSQFNIGGPSVGGAADTGYYPTFSVRTSGTVAGTALLTLNSDGFSLVGSTSTPRTITVTGSDITLNGGGNTLTLTGSISLPTPSQYRLAYGASASALGFLAAGTASSILFQTNNTTDPSWVGQNTLVVGGATTAAQWQTSRTVTFGGGDVTGSFSINGSADVGSVALTIAANSVALGTDTTGNYAQSVAVAGNGLTIGGAAGEGTDFTVYSNGVSANTVSTLVFRDGSGNFSAGTITANLTGIATSSTRVGIGTNTTNSSFPLVFSDVNQPYASLGSTTLLSVNPSTSTITATTFSGNATTATNSGASGQWSSSRTVTFGGGDVTGSFSINGSADVSSVALTIAANSVALGTDTVGNYAQSVAVAGNGLTIGGAAGEGTDFTVYSNGVSANTVSTLVFRDASGNFSAGTVTANLTGIATSATRVGISTSISSSDLPIVFADFNQPYAALGSSTLLTYQASSGKITNGIWAGSAVTAKYGGTGLATVNANQLLLGASTGNTWAAIGSSLVSVVGIGSNPPPQPGGAIGATQAGQLWWDSEYGVLKIYYVDATPTAQWVDATPVLGSSGGASSTKRSYVMTFGAGFTPSVGSDTVQIQIPYAPDNTSKYYYIKRLDYRNETVSGGTGASFFIERHTTGNVAFSPTFRIHTAGSGAGSSFVIGATTVGASWTLASTGASFVSSSGVAGSVISGDYLRLNFTTVNSAATLSVSMIIEEQ